ncbi:MAG: hypothetical protein QMC78_02785 [Methanocellales archaeon]|nr:hypothetical protein [Methanocellales archaeon]
MIRTICALVLLGLIGYTQLRKILVKKEAMKCASCGRAIIERPVRRGVRGELVFCCEHCAEAYVRTRTS